MSEILSQMYLALHTKYPILLSNFHATRIFLTDFFKKSSNIKFHENPSGGNRVVPCGRTDRHGEANSRFSQLCKRT